MKTNSRCLLVISMLLTIVHRAAAQNVNFDPAVSFDVGSGPAYVVAADVNGDGKVDLISANAYDGQLAVMTNDGSGGFALEATLDVGNFPVFVAAADVNGDGKLDLISADFGGGSGNTLTIWTNNGNGFGSNSTLTVGNGPCAVAAADVNGDGKVDLISANAYDGTLTVLTNNGNGGFAVEATLYVGSYGASWPDSVAVADVNGDGKPDLISANSNDGRLTVLTNNGSGGFGLNATLTVGTAPACVIAADLRGSGKPDLISANASDGTLTVLTNNGHGVFGSNAVFNVGLSSGSSPECVVAVDVNGDGKLDLVSANFGDDTLTILTNNGSGGFGPGITLSVGVAGSEPNSVTAADINGDGKPDLISANFGTGQLSVLVNETIFPLVAPSLAIKLTGPKNVAVSWPSSSDGFVLQQNSNLAPANWLNFSGTLNTNGTIISATINPATNNLFFRLRHP
jgi:hypothetical protein